MTKLIQSRFLGHAMFDITADDIKQLNDIDLRELVARLCEAELVSRGFSPAAVTWGGHQTAADGGLDVRVLLPVNKPIEGFIPSLLTGFQVKKPDMPRAEIIDEMRPSGAIRPVIQELANAGGAYVIVSSTGATSDLALRNRRNAMREALEGVVNSNQLHTDFYDRTRIATWIRQHPGLITWVKERAGKTLVGWRPYGPWAGAAEGVDAEYLFDDKVRLHLGRDRDASVADSIDEFRDMLAQPGKVVRLIGLSGVGKTRLVQALFDSRIGLRPLPPSFAVYTNLSDDPNPQPIGIASDLIANRTRAIIIVDNCPPDLHSRLADLCIRPGSTISILTVEYDVRDDQPESTQVVSLDTSSLELIEKLLLRRYQHISRVDARTIAEASGGNARIAIALAETIETSESISGLSDDELFQRLFRQRQGSSDALLLAAQACSLVYSFQGEILAGEEAELPRLAALVGQDVAETYHHVSELLRRELVQRRGDWRAVLPHAIANRLAALALENIPYAIIEQRVVVGGAERLLRSFSRRLSFLHTHPKAIAIVEKWLSPDGLLGDIAKLNDLGSAMFENIAPVLPEMTLAALERVGSCNHDIATTVWRQHGSLLRSLAYDPSLFERSVQILAQAATRSTDAQNVKAVTEIFISLFTIYLSGTHASIEQRLGIIESFLRSDEPKIKALGFEAMSNVLRTDRFISWNRFEFGSRSRDHGYEPTNPFDITQWYRSTLALIERLALTETVLECELRNLLAKNFRGLWVVANMYDMLEILSRRFSENSFWREGWIACRKMLRSRSNKLTPEGLSRLSALEAQLRPSNLREKVLVAILSDSFDQLSLEDMSNDSDHMKAYERLDAEARELGTAVAADNTVFSELLPDLFFGRNRAWSFGCGLASSSSDLGATWVRLITQFEKITSDQRNVQVLKGFLFELWNENRGYAQRFLDSALDQPAMQEFIPELHSAVEIDKLGVDRLKQVISTRQVPIWRFRILAYGRVTDQLDGVLFKEILLVIADQPDGFDIALEILNGRLHSDKAAKREYDPVLLDAGRELLRRMVFDMSNQKHDYKVSEVMKICLNNQDCEQVIVEITERFRQAITANAVFLFDYDYLLTALFELHPIAVLSTLFFGSENDQDEIASTFEYMIDGERDNPADAIPCEALIAWCKKDPEHSYSIAASIVSFKANSEVSGWSDQAKALLINAPDPKRVIATFVDRFQPMSWRGSRAVVMEANARLLDSLEPYISSDLMPFVSETKTKFVQSILQERKWETEKDRNRDERFEN